MILVYVMVILITWLYFTDSLAAELHNERIQEQRYKARSQSDSGLLNGHLGLSESRTQESGAESVKMGLLFQARSLDDRVIIFTN